MELTVSQLAENIGAELKALPEQGGAVVNSVGAAEEAQTDQVTFIADEKYLEIAQKSSAAAVIVQHYFEGLSTAQLIVEDVNRSLLKVLGIFAPKLKQAVRGVDESARIGENVRLGKDCSVGPMVIIEDDVEIGDRTVIAAGCKIGSGVVIGADCRLDWNVVVYHNCTIGNNVIVQASTTIGSTGFGYTPIDGRPVLVPHNGGVIIEDFVEIGANCAIDRAKFGNTIIGAGTKIDNLVQVAHNVVIGKCCMISAQTGIAGSCKVGDGVVFAGQVGLADNISIGSGTMIGGKSGVMTNIGPGKKVLWTPAVDKDKAMKIIAHLLRLPRLAQQIKKLAKRMTELEASEDNKNRS